MAPAGVDLVLGARRDPVFGPILLLGLGGTTAEALADVAIRLAPLTPDEAAAMPDELAGRALLDGWRGGPVLDPAELGRVAARPRRPARRQPRPGRDRDQPAPADRRRPDRAGRRRPDPRRFEGGRPMPTPISDHTVPWPDAAVADYVAKGYWAGVPLDACSVTSPTDGPTRPPSSTRRRAAADLSPSSPTAPTPPPAGCSIWA